MIINDKERLKEIKNIQNSINLNEPEIISNWEKIDIITIINIKNFNN